MYKFLGVLHLNDSFRCLRWDHGVRFFALSELYLFVVGQLLLVAFPN